MSETDTAAKPETLSEHVLGDIEKFERMIRALVRDEIDAITGRKSESETSTEVADIKADVPEAATDTVVAAVTASTGAPEAHVGPAVEAHAEALAAGSPPEVAHADAVAAASSAGAKPKVAAKIADSVAAASPMPDAK